MTPSLIVAFATAGRPDILTETMREVDRQSRRPDEVLICPTSMMDVDMSALESTSLPIRVLDCAKGLPVQRNVVLHHLREHQDGILVFFDDDFFPHLDYLQEVERLFAERPEVVVATGFVKADGILGPGITPDDARRVLAETCGTQSDPEVQPRYNAYGCNMCLRLSAISRNNVRFDERLPLYGWLEDVDFSRQLAPYGTIVWSSQMVGVHLGSKNGRVSGRRFGYSQIANPWYLHRKRTLTARRALLQACRNVAANFGRAACPEPWVDRRGRLIGNAIGLMDLMFRRIDPGRIIEFR